MVNFRYGLLLSVIFTFSLTVRAEIAELAISQVDVYLPDIKVYANFLDENKQPLSPAGLEVQTRLDGHPVELADSPTTFEATNEGVAYTFLLDVSGSMKGNPYRGAIEAIAELFNQMKQNDVVAVLTFGDEVQTITDFTRPNQALFNTLRGITPEAQYTHFYQAVQQAFALNQRRGNDLPTRRAILVITDGKDEGSGIQLDDLLDREVKRHSIPIYSVGFSKLRQDKEKYLDELKRLSNLSGGAFVQSDAHTDFAEIYTKTFGDIQNQMYLHVQAPDGTRADGQQHVLQVVVTDSSGNQIGDAKEVFFLDAQVIEPPTQVPVDKEYTFSVWYYILVILGGILLLLLILWLMRQNRKHAISQVSSETVTVNDTYDNQETPYKPNEGLIDEPATSTLMGAPDTTGKIESSAGGKTAFSKKIQFVVTDGQDEGVRGVVRIGEQGILIGRQGPDTTPDIILTDPKISRPHCLLQAGEDWFSVKNLSQTRSTFVNGIRINDKHTFKDDECIINLGDTTVRIQLSN